jgi:ABC-type multidrug transport system fused ATPase/permease subunit
MHFFSPSGCVCLNGIDLRERRLADLRRALAVWPQQVHVFNSTLRENVRRARPDATDQEVTEALGRAELVEFPGPPVIVQPSQPSAQG